jgi:hypothetical protein
VDADECAGAVDERGRQLGAHGGHVHGARM